MRYNARVMMPTYMIADIGALADGWGVLELFDKGGHLMWALLFLSLLALMVFFVCMWTTRQSAVLPPRMVMSVESCIRRKD